MAVAAAAAGGLAYVVPDQAQAYQKLAEEAAESRVAAGVEYPSDASAELDLGRQVARNAIQYILNDRYTLVSTGAVPTGRGVWVGFNPVGVTAPTWNPVLLSSPAEFRPAPPPDCECDQMKGEVSLVKTLPQTFNTNQKAYYWQSVEGRETWPFILAERWMFEGKTDRNPPRAARIYALLAGAEYDAYIASQDGKFTYWYLRPNQLDPCITPLFAVPNFPSYPSNHAVFSFTLQKCSPTCFPRVQTRPEPSARKLRIRGFGLESITRSKAVMRVGQAVARRFIERAA